MAGGVAVDESPAVAVPVPPDPVLAATDLVRVFGTRCAVDGVSVSVSRGSLVSIMGPSGSGKSTLLHLLGGLDRPTSGEVAIDGRVLTSLTDRELTRLRRRTIGFVFQAFNLVPVLTVEENVGLPLVIDGRRDDASERRVAEVLELVGLGDRRRQLPSELSGGEQQRTAIARALVANAPLILADEPTGNLDTVTGATILDVLRAAQRERGHTIIVVTHDPRVAAVGDQVIELRDGRVSGHLDLSAGRATTRPADRIISWLTRDD